MKKPERVWMLTGLLASSTGLALQVFDILLQTDPNTPVLFVMNSVVILLILGVAALECACVIPKQRINAAAAVVLFLLGIAGFSLVLHFGNTLVAAFFPKTHISGFLAIDFLCIAFSGVLLPIMGQSLKRNKLIP